MQPHLRKIPDVNEAERHHELFTATFWRPTNIIKPQRTGSTSGVGLKNELQLLAKATFQYWPTFQVNLVSCKLKLQFKRTKLSDLRRSAIENLYELAVFFKGRRGCRYFVTISCNITFKCARRCVEGTNKISHVLMWYVPQ